MMDESISPRAVLAHLAPSMSIPPDADDVMLWNMILSLIEPPKRDKLLQYNTIGDAIDLINKSRKILVLSGAGISTSAGIPDFRSRNGIYVQIHAQYPELNDPKSMFDINYFRKDPRPFYQFARALYPGQYQPTTGHKFIKAIELHHKLLRNYSQNIDTLEKQAGIKRVVECHGSFATASCTSCRDQVDGDAIRDEVLSQKVPRCSKCSSREGGPLDDLGVMKPDIVFFGEQLGDEFHASLDQDKDEVDLLIVIGSSLKVRPVALIPRSIPANVPQILINKEPLDHLTFDIELLGDCDEIISELCLRLGHSWTNVCEPKRAPLREITGLPNEIFIARPENSMSASDQSNSRLRQIHSPGGSSEAQESNQSPIAESSSAPNDDDDDDDDAWDDIEILDDSEAIVRRKADLKIPPGTYIYLRPNVYLFQDAELTGAQCEVYRKLDLSLQGKEETDS